MERPPFRELAKRIEQLLASDAVRTNIKNKFLDERTIHILELSYFGNVY